jgi:hypothetical protein
MNKLFIIILGLALLPVGLKGQGELGAFNATGSGIATALVSDYQCLGINPSNLGWSADTRSFHLGFSEISASIYSEPLTKKDISRFFSEETYTDAEKVDAARRFTNARSASDFGSNNIAFSYQHPEIGGFAVSMRDRISWNMKLNNAAAELLWLGFNADYFDEKVVENGITVAGISSQPKSISSLFSGTSFSTIWSRDYYFGYGRKLFKANDFTAYGGVDFKYILGFAMIDVRIDDEHISGISALSPMFEMDYPQPSPSNKEGGVFSPAGRGLGFDLGLSFIYKNRLRLGLALNDLGSVKWDGNVYTASYSATIKRIETPGLGSETIDDIVNSIAVEDQLFEWAGLESSTVNLPTHFRMGVVYLPVAGLEVGFDLMTPMNNAPGSMDKPMFGLGARYNAVGRLRLSTGITTGGNYSFNVPFGISVGVLKGWEIGVATHDISSLFREENPNISVAFGFLRFSFGKYLVELNSPDNVSEGL